MASPQDNAALSDAVYGGPGNTKAPPGWTMIDQSRVDPGNAGTSNGYYGAAFQNDQTGEIVIANRGSRLSGEGLKQDWGGSDVQIVKQNPNDIPPAFGDANNFAARVRQKNPDAQINYTGHSLGGGEAEVQAASDMHGGRAMTFGAPGTAFAVKPWQAAAAKDRVVNYVLPGDPVPLSGTHIGQTVVLTPAGSTLLKDAAAVGVGLAVGGPLGALIAIAGIAATHMLGNYQAALNNMFGGGGAGGGGMPQARISDMHVCPMVTGVVPHVGGPIALGCFTVLVGELPAARVGDMAVCVGPPDAIAMGSFTVLIGGMPAARLGDMTVHGGNIVLGDFTVLTG